MDETYESPTPTLQPARLDNRRVPRLPAARDMPKQDTWRRPSAPGVETCPGLVSVAWHRSASWSGKTGPDLTEGGPRTMTWLPRERRMASYAVGAATSFADRNRGGSPGWLSLYLVPPMLKNPPPMHSRYCAWMCVRPSAWTGQVSWRLVAVPGSQVRDLLVRDLMGRHLRLPSLTLLRLS